MYDTLTIAVDALGRDILYIGREGENGWREIRVDCRAWLAEHPDGQLALVVRRPDGACYPADVTVADGAIVWSPTDADTAVRGMGYIEARLLDGDTVGKSALGITMCDESLSGGDAPATPQPDWVDAVSRNAAAAQAAKDEAEAAKDEAQAARGAAETAKGNAENAQVAAEAAKDLSNTYAQSAYQSYQAAVALVGNLQASTWEEVQNLVRAGWGPTIFPVGEQLTVSHSEYGGGKIIMDVMGHNIYPDPTGRLPHTMMVLMRDCIYGRMISNRQLLWANNGDEPLPAGTYHLTLFKGAYGGGVAQDGTYEFTITQPIPVGGGFRHTAMGVYQSSGYTKAQILAGTFTTYGAGKERPVIESGLATTEGSGGTSLGTASRNYADTAALVGAFNSTERNAYGSNHHGESAARQWLGSEAPGGAWFALQTIFDMPPDYASRPGFLQNIDPEFAAALVAVDVITARNNYYEIGGTMGGSYVTREKVFPISMTEMGLGNNNSVAEGSVLPYYVGATQADRIKYDIANPSTARHVWLRSPNPSYASDVRIVNPSGALNSYRAYNGHGLAAACNIG